MFSKRWILRACTLLLSISSLSVLPFEPTAHDPNFLTRVRGIKKSTHASVVGPRRIKIRMMMPGFVLVPLLCRMQREFLKNSPSATVLAAQVQKMCSPRVNMCVLCSAYIHFEYDGTGALRSSPSRVAWIGSRISHRVRQAGAGGWNWTGVEKNTVRQVGAGMM